MKSTKFDLEFVNKILKEKEGKSLDFKQKITSREKIAKTLAAMCNTDGGLLVIGLSDQKKIIGIDPEEERFMIESANEEYCIPRVSLSVHEVKIFEERHLLEADLEEKSLLVVEIHKTLGPPIYCKSKNGELKTYRRFGDQTLAV